MSQCSSMGCKEEPRYEYITNEEHPISLCERHGHVSYVDTRYVRVFLHNCSMSRCPARFASREKQLGWLCPVHE